MLYERRKEYDGNVKHNAEVAYTSEKLVRELLSQIYVGVDFYDKHDDVKSWHKGDILSSEGKWFDAKDDGVIFYTGNLFAEELKDWRNGEISDGWMHSSKYSYVCDLDQQGKKLYIIDFKRLKEIYKKNNKYKKSRLSDCDSWGYIVPLWKLRESGALVAEVAYYWDDDWEMYLIDTAAEA